MTNEEKNIKNKIDGLSDLDFFLNDKPLWERLEARLDKQQPDKHYVAWFWLAAGLVITGMSVYFHLLTPESPKLQYVVTTPKTISNTTPPSEAAGRRESTTKKTVRAQQKLAEPKAVTDDTESNRPEERLLVSDIACLEPVSKHEFSISPKNILQHTVTFKVQRVTTLNLPAIPDVMLKREPFAKRMFRQVRSFNTEGKIDWRELNIEPRNVWAYLERSFINDTTKTKSLKTIK